MTTRSAWWARAQAEQPLAGRTTCPRPECSKRIDSPFDLYCRTGQPSSNEFHFVVAGRDRRIQTIAIYAARALFGLLALFAARSGSRIPLDIASGLAGALLLVLPLRHFRTSRAVAVISWACLFTLTVAAHQGWLSSSGEDLSITIVLTLAVIGLPLAVAMTDGNRAAGPLRRGLALSMAVAFGAILMFIAFTLGLDSVTAPASEISLLVCGVALGGVASGAALTGFVSGFGKVKIDDVRPRAEPRVNRPPRVHFKDPQAFVVKSFSTRVAYVALVAMSRLVNGCAEVLNRAVSGIVDAANAAVHVVFWIEFAVRLAAVWTFRLLNRATLEALDALEIAARHVGMATVRWAISTVAGLVLLAAAAQLATIAAALFGSYLGGATLLDGIGAPVLALATGGLLISTWSVLTRWPWTHVARSALHTAEGAGPSLFLTLVALGWIDGIAGMLGFGPLRPGWLTVSGTVVLIVGGVYVIARERRQRHATPAPGPSASP
jgi:hypothetical protein